MKNFINKNNEPVVDKDGKPMGLIEQIREKESNKPEVNIEEEFSKPPKKPNTDTIYCGIEFAKKFKKMLYG